MSEDITLEREELYRKVWSEPMSRLAPKYGLTDNGLKKICKKLKIPVPPRGYWARQRYGYKDKKTKLPKLKYGDPDTYTLQVRKDKIAAKKCIKEENLSPETLELINTANKKSKQIRVSQKLTSPHPLVHKARKHLKKDKLLISVQ